MQYKEWYEIYWTKPDDDPDYPTSGVVHHDVANTAWVEYDAMRRDPQVSKVVLLRHSTVRLAQSQRV